MLRIASSAASIERTKSSSRSITIATVPGLAYGGLAALAPSVVASLRVLSRRIWLASRAAPSADDGRGQASQNEHRTAPCEVSDHPVIAVPGARERLIYG